MSTLADIAAELTGQTQVASFEKWVQTLLILASDGDPASVDELRSLASGGAGGGCDTWLRLLSVWRPVIVLVDHLDGFYRNEQAGLRIAMLLLDLTDLDGVHIVLSLNQDVWQATFGHHLPSALEDRLTASQVLLRGLTADDAAEIIRLRLAQAGIPADEAAKFQKFLDAKRYFLGRPLGSVSARVFLRHAAQQWLAFQSSVEGPGGDLDEAPVEEESLLPVIQEKPPAAPLMGEVPVFDTHTTDYMRRVAEGLSEPVAALPQNDTPPLPPPAAPLPQPPLVNDLAGPAATSPFSIDAAPVDDPSVASMPTLGAAASVRSAGAFEKLREMLDKLRAADAGQAAAANGRHLAAHAAEPPADGTHTAPAAGPTSRPARDVLLGRFEALRLQMAAEAESCQIDLSKLTDLVHLAGKRFPLVHFDEVELPGLTGKTVARWTLKGAEILFGLSDFADRRYWQTLALFAAGRLTSIAENAAHTGEPAAHFKIVVFKSDRDTASWTLLSTAHDVFPAAVREHIDPIHLDVRSIAALYAMQRMIKEAATGAIKAEPALVMSVLARELDFFWKRVTRPLLAAK